MNEVERALHIAITTNADPAIVSPEGVKFAWAPVFGWDHITRTHRSLWMEWVIWFRPLGLLTEYSSYEGSEKKFYDNHGYYSWQRQ